MKSANRMIIGIGTPISQSRMPLPIRASSICFVGIKNAFFGELFRGNAGAAVCVFGSKEAKMPRYYFHQSDGGFVSDNRGKVWPTRKDAEEYAVSIAGELGRNRDNIPDGLSVLVTDEMGREVFRTPVVNHARKVTADAIVETLRHGEEKNEDAE